LLTILGIWKILGVIAVLVPKFPLLKEWVYAGFFFVMTRAIFSHIALKDPVKEMLPAWLLLILTFVSWYFRLADRKIVTLVNK
jgi:energy-coupling factor transporter transmembrane protein EcfT